MSSYLKQVTDYIPFSISSISNYIPGVFQQNPEQSKHVILWKKFEQWESSDKTQLFLILGLENCFRIYHMNSSASVPEFLSQGDCVASSVKLLPVSKLFSEEGPIIAVISADRNNIDFPPSSVRFFSILKSSFFYNFRCPSPIHDVMCNDSRFLVFLENSIQIFDINTLHLLFTTRCCLNQPHMAIGSLGHRLIAYTGPLRPYFLREQLIPESENKFQPGAGNISYSDVKSYLQTQASGLVKLGETSRQKINEYLISDNSEFKLSITSDKSRLETEPGIIIIRDLQTFQILDLFKAHTSHLSSLAFDKSGTLLISVSEIGQYLNIYQLRLGRTGNSRGSKHIYRVFRGITCATIRIAGSFSSDSRWLSVTSNRGTTHIYALNPRGGPVNTYTHGPIVINRNAPMLEGLHARPSYIQPSDTSLYNLDTVYRIHSSNSDSKYSNNSIEFGPSAISLFHPFSNDLIDNLCIISPDNQLIINRVDAQFSADPYAGAEPKLSLFVENIFTCDLSSLADPESKPILLSEDHIKKIFSIPIHKHMEQKESDTKILSQSGMISFAADDCPLILAPRFTFKNFKGSSLSNDAIAYLRSANEHSTGDYSSLFIENIPSVIDNRQYHISDQDFLQSFQPNSIAEAIEANVPSPLPNLFLNALQPDGSFDEVISEATSSLPDSSPIPHPELNSSISSIHDLEIPSL